MPSIADEIRARGAALNEQKFQLEQTESARDTQLQVLREARDQALAEKRLMIDATNLQRQAQADADAAGFLKYWQHVKPDDPEYEDKREELMASFPFAGHDDTVKSTVQDRNATRQTYIETTKSGGAFDFPEGPARNEFHRIFKETGDFNQAKAGARTVATDDKEVQDLLGQGHLTGADFAHAEGQPLPAIYNQDGTINYRQAKLIGKERAGKVSGKVAAAEDADIRTAQAFVTSYLAQAPNRIEEDPTAAELYRTYSKQLLAHAKKQGGDAAPTKAAPAAAGKPAVVIQKGVTYNLQPDGTYK